MRRVLLLHQTEGGAVMRNDLASLDVEVEVANIADADVAMGRPDFDAVIVEAAANVSMRIAAHNAGHSPLTATHRPWRLVAVVQFGNEGTAQRFEKFLKSSAGRAFVKHHFVQ